MPNFDWDTDPSIAARLVREKIIINPAPTRQQVGEDLLRSIYGPSKPLVLLDDLVDHYKSVDIWVPHRCVPVHSAIVDAFVCEFCRTRLFSDEERHRFQKSLRR